MILLDSNIVIYSAKSDFLYLRPLLFNQNTSISMISKVEVLGFHALIESEKQYFETVFSITSLLPINTEIIDKAVQLRQQKNLSLGDSIIAATALFFDAELYTRNVSDFKHIQGMKLHNPIT
jgi:toxin FitB